jgi:hypothetical protein
MQIVLINKTDLWAKNAFIKRKIQAAIKSVVTRDIQTRHNLLINCGANRTIVGGNYAKQQP